MKFEKKAKKKIKIEMCDLYVTVLRDLLDVYLIHAYILLNIIQWLYNKIHLNNV